MNVRKKMQILILISMASFLTAGPALADPAPDLPFELDGQVFAPDWWSAHYLHTGNLEKQGQGEDEIPESILVPHGVPRIIWNRRTQEGPAYEVDENIFYQRDGEDLVPCTWSDLDWGVFYIGQIQVPYDPGIAADAVFLDLDEDEDHLDDHVYVACTGGLDLDRSSRDQLFKIEEVAGLGKYVLVEEPLGWYYVDNSDPQNPVQVSMDEQHKATVIKTSKAFDTDPNEDQTYLVIGGGVYSDKQGMDNLARDKLRVLAYDPDKTTGGKTWFRALRTGGNDPEMPNIERLATDVEILKADSDGLTDILVTFYNPGGLLAPLPTSEYRKPVGILRNTGMQDGVVRFEDASGVYGDLADWVVPGGNQRVALQTLGSGVGDFDGDGDTDLLLLYRPGTHEGWVRFIGEWFLRKNFYADIALYRNDNGQFTVIGTPVTDTKSNLDDNIDWLYTEDDEIRTRSLSDRRSYDAIALDHNQDGQIDYMMVGSGFPYILINQTPSDEPGGDTVTLAFEDFLIDEDAYQKRKGSPLFNIYSSAGVLVSDLDGDGNEEVVFSNLYEQDRLWQCEYSAGAIDVEDVTVGYLPAGGENSNRFIPGRVLVDSEEVPFVLAVNMYRGPNIYKVDYITGEIEDGYDLLEQPRLDIGGWDGVLEDFDQDGNLDLVIAAGAWNDANPNLIFEWDPNDEQFEESVTNPPRIPADAYNTRGVAAGDLDGDGYKDLVFCNSDTEVFQVSLYDESNDRFGSYVGYGDAPNDPVLSSTLGYHAVAIINDEEGTGDILAGGLGAIHVYTNDGDGTFTAGTPLSWTDYDLDPGFNVVDDMIKRFVPINAEGCGVSERKDLLVCVVNGKDRIFLSNGSGGFESTPIVLPEATDTWDAAVIDLDGDGYDDIITAGHTTGTANGNGHENRVYLNRCEEDPGDGDPGDFCDQTDLYFDVSEEEDGTRSVTKFNGDGTFDVLVLEDLFGPHRHGILTANDGQNRLYRQDSSATAFAITGTGDFGTGSPGQDELRSVVRKISQDSLSQFKALTDGSNPRGEVDVCVGDLDSSTAGEEIAVTMSWPLPHPVVPEIGYVQTNVYSRSGSFLNTIYTLPLAPTSAQSGREDTVTTAVGDVDDDGDVELIVAQGRNQSGATWYSQVRIYDGDGDSLGSFTVYTGTLAEEAGVYVAAGDIDDDGVDEIVVVNGPVSTNQVLVRAFEPNGTLMGQFYAFSDTEDEDRRAGGGRIAVGNLDCDPEEEILVIHGPVDDEDVTDTKALVYDWDQSSPPPNGTGTLHEDIEGFLVDEERSIGVDVAIRDVRGGDAFGEILVSELDVLDSQEIELGSWVRAFSADGTPIPDIVFQAYTSSENPNGGVHVEAMVEVSE